MTESNALHNARLLDTAHNAPAASTPPTSNTNEALAHRGHPYASAPAGTNPDERALAQDLTHEEQINMAKAEAWSEAANCLTDPTQATILRGLNPYQPFTYLGDFNDQADHAEYGINLTILGDTDYPEAKTSPQNKPTLNGIFDGLSWR